MNRRPSRLPRINARSGLWSTVSMAAMILGSAVGSTAMANVTGVSIGENYLASGDQTTGRVTLDSEGEFPADARLRVTLVRTVDVPAKPGDAADSTSKVVLDLPIAQVNGKQQVEFPIDSAGALSGSVQASAQIVTGSMTRPLSGAWSTPTTIGVRHHVSLAGEWPVTNVKNLDYKNQWRPATWTVPVYDKPLTIPGRISFEPWFKGWVTLSKEIHWKLPEGLSPRFLYTEGVSNSVLAKVDGAVIGETQPVEDLDCEISHWGEYHSQFKGEENKAKRQMLYDTDVLPPMEMPLPKMGSEGKANFELTVRGTAGEYHQIAYGIFGEPYLEATPNVYIKSVSFDTEKPGEKRKFKFQLTVVNDSGSPFKGTLHNVYGLYQGELPYSGACPAYASADQAVSLPVGESTVEVDREETPRFATCRATFVLEDAKSKVLDAQSQEFHTVVLEIKDRRDLYLNNERFIIKFQGSYGDDAASRLTMKVAGANGFRGHTSKPSFKYPGLWSSTDSIAERYREGLLTSAGSALLASCERCAFWNPKDHSNIDRAAKNIIRNLAQSPGIIEWETTNELFGEPDEARIAIQEAFHKLDPYHRPILATKGSGEWEAVAHDGRVPGVDIVGCQYLLSKEAIDSVTAAITEQPLMCTEVNFNDQQLLDHDVFDAWMAKGLTGTLLFDYSGNATHQPVPILTAPGNPTNYSYEIYQEKNRQLFQDAIATATQLPDGRIRFEVGNRAPYALRDVVLQFEKFGKFDLPDLTPGDVATVILPAQVNPGLKNPIIARTLYTTHSGLKHVALLTPTLTAEANTEKSK